MTITQTTLYCPGVDTEMDEEMRDAISKFTGMHRTYFAGGQGGLAALDPKAKLIIFCHGHKEMPLFVTTCGKWRADALAKLLEQDGLRKDHREIELWVCRAGASLTTATEAKARLELYDKAMAAHKRGDTAAFNKIRDTYEERVENGPGPRNFEFKPELNLLPPLAALLTDALKKRGYNYFRITSYPQRVSTVFDGGILRLYKEKEGLAIATENDKQIWQ